MLLLEDRKKMKIGLEDFPFAINQRYRRANIDNNFGRKRK
jgi:hypothetical protein